MFGKLVKYETQKQSICIEFENGNGIISVVNDSIINVFSQYEEIKIESKAIEHPLKENVSFEVVKHDNFLKITTKKVIIKVYDEFYVDFYQQDGTLLCNDYRGKRSFQANLSNEFAELMAQEGHQVAKETYQHKIQILKELETDQCIYGLGDRTGFLNKRGYAYELWNTDDPMPHVDSFKTLYKSIPFIISLSKDQVYGIFFDNTNRSYWDLGKENQEYYYFAADQGNLDYYFIAGNSIPDIISGYTNLTGTVPRPQLWTLGYQQSRWGYETEKQVRELALNMRKHQVPCDVIHLDIDYMERFKVFTWDKEAYHDANLMIKDLSEDGYKIVTIIDPGVKVENGYHVYEEGKKKGYFVTSPDGDIYINTVWPGDSVFPDFGSQKVRTWWADNHKFLVDMGVRGVWNDMNEPASFNGEIPENIVFSDEDRKTTHAEMHNVYGHFMSKATYEGLKKYDKRRPFVISRACYAGSQKYATAWTGDNFSIWAHLQMAISQLCNLGLSGMSFVGTDIGGFGSDTTPELLTRWVQVGCFSPLFRNHSNKGTRDQEPWQFDDKTLDIYRKYVELRYRLLPYYYDLYVNQETDGLPILRPLVLHYEGDLQVRELNDEFLVGENLLIAPVVVQGAAKRMVYLPEGIWFDYWSGEQIQGGKYFIVDAPIDVCPIYAKAGAIIPNYPVQNYVGEKDIKELTLQVFEGEGNYLHTQDDGESFDYEEGIYNQYSFTMNVAGEFTCTMLHAGYAKKYESLRILYKGRETVVALKGKKKLTITLY
jgi:alpha-glucosidase